MIDQAADLVGANRSQFMLASALKEAKAVLLDQTTLYTGNRTFQQVLDWLDQPASADAIAGMRRIKDAKAPWLRD
ncbi:DUF1778 domain-containing protein [Rhodopseudomonas parapalustris]